MVNSVGSHEVLLKSFLVEYLKMTENHGWSIAIGIPGFVSFKKKKDLEEIAPKTSNYKARHIELIHENLGIKLTECN